MADPNQLRFLASKGFFGHSATLEPDTFVANNHQSFGIAQEDLSPLQQAVKELPGDLMNAFSPSGIANSAGLLYDAAKNGLTGKLPPGPQAKNDVNEVGMPDRLKIPVTPEPPASPMTNTQSATHVRTKAEADLNERLMHQGMAPEDILSAELARRKASEIE